MSAITGPVGFVGLGAMGAPMATRLAAAGFELHLYDLDSDRVRALSEQLGATLATAPVDLGSCFVVITMLPDSRAVHQVVLGADGLIPHLGAGRIIVDMSSSAPAATIELAAACAECGVSLVDAPVSGGVRRAVDGTLAIMAGGDAADVDRVQPLLDVLGSNVFRTGPTGSGHALKALNNMLSAIGLAGAAEVLSVGIRFGLDPAVMIDVLNASSGRNNSTESKFVPFILSGTFDSGFALRLMVKDLLTALDLAHQTEVSVPLAAACTELSVAAQRSLGETADHTELAAFIAALNGGVPVGSHHKEPRR